MRRTPKRCRAIAICGIDIGLSHFKKQLHHFFIALYRCPPKRCPTHFVFDFDVDLSRLKKQLYQE
ncbi:hypothetical protein BFJ63_vAg18301 [Fusarium oxysporum f. sp. narcissi]|uniref:Uncharacterized protein n=2 Tax=Fusarium oxysporum TaxID=5507 RepID=A0A4V1RXP5_FUSOX|nr:hypothetical protein BFJ65_g15018 [Fusarium oxysporum f. sp. cepae]RYC78826.1 hypothetical protein BFJ63_vAg18301 [Fusarium oxysporum f. sp. narcissi]